MSDASQLATAHYPETLDRIFVVGAPSFFPTVWEYAKRWFDPITVSKIFILSEKNMRSTLEQYVDLDNLPKKYGGNLDWEFGDMPALDPGIVKALDWKETTEQKGHKTLPIGPIRWEYEDENGKKGDHLVAKAIGTEKGKPRRNVIAGLHPEAGLARLALSPGRQSVPGNKSQSISNGGGSRTASATAASVQSSTPVAAASSSSPSQDQSTTPTTTSETKRSTEGKKMNAPADYMNPVEGEEGGNQTTNTKTAGEGEGKNTYLDYSGLGAGAATAGAGAGAAGAAGATAAGTSTPTSTSTDQNAAVPTNTTTSSPSAPQQETRQGTSSTRYAQQEGAHAAGQLASGTPETKIDSQGEKQGIMEPGTVGQAPKKHPLRDELGEEVKGGNEGGAEGKGNGGSGGSSGVMGQASSYANSAVQSAKSGAVAVMGAVGISGGGGRQKEEEEEKKQEEEAEKEKERRRDDPEVEQMDGRNVEEFLRSKTASAAEPMKR
ncbi:hypothetical protein KC316_g9189 [Hortaea werneckii]|nr:hypothetical protein KC316_g9189 [Hortaea werneckii]